MDINPSTVFKKNIEYRVRMFDGVNLLSGDNHYHELNEFGEEIWNLIDGESSVADIVTELTKEFTVEREVMEQDICEFLQELFDLGTILKVNQ